MWKIVLLVTVSLAVFGVFAKQDDDNVEFLQVQVQEPGLSQSQLTPEAGLSPLVREKRQYGGRGGYGGYRGGGGYGGYRGGGGYGGYRGGGGYGGYRGGYGGGRGYGGGYGGYGR